MKTGHRWFATLVYSLGLVTSLSGCVGGASDYFESVTRENRLNAAQNSQPATLTVEPVEVTELPSADNAQIVTAENQANAQPVQSAGLGDAAEQSTATTVSSGNSVSSLPDNANGNPTQLVVSSSGEVMTTPNLPITSTATRDNIAVATPSINPDIPATGAQALKQPTLAYASTDQGNNLLSGNALGNLNGGSSGFVLGTESNPVIDPAEASAQLRIDALYPSVEHGQCDSGWGPKPKKISAKRINAGDPYYIELRMRQTPLMPVGHTYVAYGKLGADGVPLDEKLIMLAPIGGYAGAALASGIPMSGILKPHRDDCKIQPDVGYRVSLSAQRYEKLLLEVNAVRNKPPKYLLFSYNCNHFMTRMAQSVGIKPPSNIYVPAIQYLYDMIDENEGTKVARF